MSLPGPELGAGGRGGPGPEEPRSADFRRSVAEGVRWSAISLVAKQAGRALISIVLARLIGPRSYGIVGQATVYIMLTTFFLDGGFGAAFIQKDKVDERDEASVYWMTLAATTVMVLVTLLIAPALAAFFATPELTAVVRVLAVDVALLGLAGAPASVLTRRLRFRALGLAQVVGIVVGGTAGIVAATMGAEHWSLVVFSIVNDAVVLALVATACGRPPLRPSRRSLARMWSFGLSMTGAQFLYYTMRIADNVLVGKFLGATALGFYALSYRVLMLPQQTLGYVVNRVSFPVFSRLQDDREQMGRYFLRATRLMAFVSFPAMALVFASARTAVPLVFGDQWRPAATTMQILAVAGLMSSVQHLVRPVLYASGRQATALRVQSALTLTSVVAFAVGLQWGIAGVASAVAVVLWSFGPVLVHYAGREAGISLADYARALRPAAAGSLALLAVFALTARAFAVVDGPEGVSLAVSILASGAAYLLCLRALWPTQVAEGLHALRMLTRPGTLATAMGKGGRQAAAGAGAQEA